MHKMITTCVIGRGESLKDISKIDGNISHTIISNNFDRESNNLDIVNFMKGKKNISMICRGNEQMSNKNTYELLDIKKCVLNVFEKEFKEDKSAAHKKGTMHMYGVECQCLPDSILNDSIDGKGSFPTTGMLAVVYAINALKSNNVYIIGIDCYDSEYFNGMKATDVQKNIKGKKMKEFLYSITNKYPDVNFFIYSYANFDLTKFSDNVKVM